MECNLDKTSGANNVWNNHEMVAVIKTQTHNQKTRVYISIMISASTRQRPGTSVSSFKPSFPDTQGDWGFQRSNSEITLDVVFISEDSESAPPHGQIHSNKGRRENGKDSHTLVTDVSWAPINQGQPEASLPAKPLGKLSKYTHWLFWFTNQPMDTIHYSQKITSRTSSSSSLVFLCLLSLKRRT